ncbi:hypothetical protein J4440_04610 [Candidatus Woesearchaeota archaeon]|nr:hypothetical protein [Candidatus Woesearchaeota archaeon]
MRENVAYFEKNFTPEKLEKFIQTSSDYSFSFFIDELRKADYVSDPNVRMLSPEEFLFLR